MLYDVLYITSGVICSSSWLFWPRSVVIHYINKSYLSRTMNGLSVQNMRFIFVKTNTFVWTNKFAYVSVVFWICFNIQKQLRGSYIGVRPAEQRSHKHFELVYKWGTRQSFCITVIQRFSESFQVITNPVFRGFCIIQKGLGTTRHQVNCQSWIHNGRSLVYNTVNYCWGGLKGRCPRCYQ